jgi:hypothetical protein
MAHGLKIAKYDANSDNGAAQKDQSMGPNIITYASSTSSQATVYEGGTGGYQTNTTSLVILANYKDSAGYLHNDGQIIKQKGSHQFNVQSLSSGTASITRCTLVSTTTLAASQMYIRGVSPTGVQFYASRITDRFVWDGNNVKYPFVLGTPSAVTYIDTTSTNGVTFYAAGTTQVIGPFAVVEGG